MPLPALRADQRQPAGGNQQSQQINGTHPLAQQQRGKEQREERLRLQNQRSQPGGHAYLHCREQERELPQ